jgi:hypothetical protein
MKGKLGDPGASRLSYSQRRSLGQHKKYLKGLGLTFLKMF